MPKPLIQTTGRRKQAVARVRLRPGTGQITVNGATVEDYFPSETHRMILSPSRCGSPTRPRSTTSTPPIDGGGVSGQAGRPPPRHRPGPRRARPRAPGHAEEGRLPHPRRPREGEQEVRPEEGPQGAAVLQALTASPPVTLAVRHRRGAGRGHHRAHPRARPRPGPRRGPGPRTRDRSWSAATPAQSRPGARGRAAGRSARPRARPSSRSASPRRRRWPGVGRRARRLRRP